jgi:hypothetical protein
MLRRVAAIGLLCCTAVAAEDAAVAPPPAPAVPLADALARKQVSAEIGGNGRDTATLKLANSGKAALKVTLPAGTVLAGENGEKQITLRALTTDLAAGSEADAILPTAALSSKNTATQRVLSVVPAGEARLAKLLEFFDKQNDLPRPTAQLAVFIVLEDADWAAWQKWLAPAWTAEKPAKQHPTPAEVAQAVDALAFAKLSAPDKKPALLANEEFKRLALRNPWARAKAMALYGLSVEDALTGDSSLPPDLGKLLHTAPNDNCPICRQRAQMQKGNDF